MKIIKLISVLLGMLLLICPVFNRSGLFTGDSIVESIVVMVNSFSRLDYLMISIGLLFDILRRP